MYFICKFPDATTLFDAEEGTRRPLANTEADLLGSLFTHLSEEEGKILVGVQVALVGRQKLPDVLFPGSCFIGRFASLWMVQHEKEMNGRLLNTPEIDLLRTLFPRLWNLTGQPQLLVQVLPIPAVKLVNLPVALKPAAAASKAPLSAKV